MSASSKANTAPSLERDPKLWFADGTIIIRAEYRIFKVYYGILAAKSPIFQDMLSIPQPSKAETLEGCPIVVLHDSAADMTLFLKAIFGFAYIRDPKEISVLLAVLRLSTKYEVTSLRRRMLSRFSLLFPMEPSDLLLTTEIFSTFTFFVVLHVAVALDIPWLVLAMTYICCRAPMQDIIDNATGASMRTCAIISSELEARFRQHIVAVLNKASASDRCPTPSECACVMYKLPPDYRDRDGWKCSLLDADSPLWKILQRAGPMMMCKKCYQAIRSKRQYFETDFLWNKLVPQHCGITLASALERMKEDLEDE